jgi:hypothetical protein
MRVNNAKLPNPAGLLVLALSLIGAFAVIQWIYQNIPSSLESFLGGIAYWLTTPQASPLGVIGFLMVLVIVFVVLTYPMVMRT